MESQEGIVHDKGGTMRLGAYDCDVERRAALAHRLYGSGPRSPNATATVSRSTTTTASSSRRRSARGSKRRAPASWTWWKMVEIPRDTRSSSACSSTPSSRAHRSPPTRSSAASSPQPLSSRREEASRSVDPSLPQETQMLDERRQPTESAPWSEHAAARRRVPAAGADTDSATKALIEPGGAREPGDPEKCGAPICRRARTVIDDLVDARARRRAATSTKRSLSISSRSCGTCVISSK